MAYYSYNNQGEFNGDYYYHSLNFNYSTYNYPVPVQDYQIYGYDPIPSTISYSVVTTPVDPKFIQYDPSPTSDSAHTQFIISYSVSHFNDKDDDDDEFEEYDPTPYDGGYDLSLTYGNPLPPSDETCYPRSAASSSAAAAAASPIGVPPAPISTPAGKFEAESKPTASGRINDVVQEEKEAEEEEEEEDCNFGSGSGGEVSYGYEKRVGEMPYGYGLEAMDICEGLLGYWPCLSRCRRRLEDYQEVVADWGNCRNPWDEPSDYLFGNPNPYAETREGEISFGQNYWGSYRP